MKSLLLVLALIGVVAAQWPRQESQDEGDLAYQRFLFVQRMRMRMEAERMEAARAEKEEQDSESSASIAMIKKKCDKYGHAGAFEDVERALVQTKSCVMEAFRDVPNNMYGIRQKIRYGCSVAPRLGRCVINLGEAVKPCMPPKRRENFQLANLTNELISYACDNDGARVHDLILNDGPECFQNKADELKECAEKYETKEAVNSLDNSIESGEVTDSQCQQSTELRKCMEGKLMTCSHPSALLTFKGIMDIAEKYSPCSSKQVMPERMYSVHQTQ